jgi:DnaJ family protein C protein 2
LVLRLDIVSQALKKYGKEDSERWEHVAQMVPGKSKAACMRRFKELRETFRAKKN